MRGDIKAFERLFIHYSPKVYNIARTLHVGHEDAEGLVQNLFIKIWERRKELDCHKSFNAYLFTISKSMVLKLFRKTALQTGYEKYALGYLKSSTNETEENIIYEDLSSITSQYLDQLPKKQKQVFILKNIEHLSVDEIAEKLDISTRTVENQIYRASKTLKGKISNLHSISFLAAILISF